VPRIDWIDLRRPDARFEQCTGRALLEYGGVAVMAGLFLPERFRQAFRLEQIEGRYDPVVFGSALALAALGLVMVASSSIAIAEGLEVGPFYFLTRHLVFLAVGSALGLLLARIELKHVEKHSHLLLLLCFALLLAVFLPGIGKSVNGARRWLNLGISGFQAVEAVKLMLIIWLSSYLVRYREQVQNEWLGLIKPLGVAGGLVLILLAQPDFGSAVLLCAIVGGMVWLGGVRIRNLVAPVLLALPVLGWAAMSEAYRVRRLTSFMDPWKDPFNDGFQLTQALIAIGRGEWFGVGLGASVQKLFYLPEAHTDFIFSVIAEELGFAGVLLVLALFTLLVGRAFLLGLRAVELRRHFAGFCAFGVALWLGLQTLVSIGVNLGLLPTKGLTLPLISSGGSSVLMTCAAVGLLLRVSYELDRAQRQVARVRSGVAAVLLDDEDAAAAEPPPGGGPRDPLRRRIEPSLGRAA
jgi:cell division protein FtsW